ncbi:response regulator transcription factor [Aeromicrobium sp. PE09-221]|uniref:response regulator transcription factor n=1 Tax=Aeromicrobium sp. PE09-221 TaxID=1898043 RepID=UPI001483B5F4|nr:response regulator transcription factor [Aeromicrobium sp. PE09-221]
MATAMMSAIDAESRISTCSERPELSHPDTACRPQRVLVVDDHELVQAGLRALLARESWVTMCLGASSAEMAVEVARRAMPQLILVSMSVRGQSGLDLCRELLARMPHVRVVLMSSEGRVSTSLAQAHGAVGFIRKGMPAAAIVTAVKRVAEGEKVFPKAMSELDDVVALSKREMDVLQHLVSGLSNPEVAARLHLSRHTVKQHTSTVYRKLGVKNRAQAASRAQALGLVA